MFSLPRAQVLFLVRKLGSHQLHSRARERETTCPLETLDTKCDLNLSLNPLQGQWRKGMRKSSKEEKLTTLPTSHCISQQCTLSIPLHLQANTHTHNNNNRSLRCKTRLLCPSSCLEHIQDNGRGAAIL